MAFKGGTNAIFKIDNGAGSLTDISAYLKTTSFPRTDDVYDTTVFGKTAKTYIPGLTDGTFPLGGPWDPTIDGILGAIFGGATATTVSYYYAPHGTGTGNITYTGEGILKNYNIESPVDGAVSWTAEVQCSDTVTRTVL